jgi:hypothetical protein
MIEERLTLLSKTELHPNVNLEITNRKFSPVITPEMGPLPVMLNSNRKNVRTRKRS